jgi:NAD-dependent dihydropyrimidine dehydrogenase PreA subunit
MVIGIEILNRGYLLQRESSPVLIKVENSKFIGGFCFYDKGYEGLTVLSVVLHKDGIFTVSLEVFGNLYGYGKKHFVLVENSRTLKASHRSIGHNVDLSVTVVASDLKRAFATGKTLSGEIVPAVDFKDLCNGIGITNVHVVNPYDLDELTKVIKEEVKKEELSVIIAKAPCALLKGQKHPYKVEPVPEKCVHCGECVEACPRKIIWSDKSQSIAVTIDPGHVENA